MSQLQNRPSYCNSLSTVRHTTAKNPSLEPLVALKARRPSKIYKFFCCFCVPNQETLPRKQGAKNSYKKFVEDSNEIMVPDKNPKDTTIFMENSKSEENLKSTKIIQPLKTKSHFEINEIMTPTERKSKNVRQLLPKTSHLLKRNRSEENLAKIILSSFPKNQIYFLKYGEKYLLGRNLHRHFKNNNHDQSQNFSVCSGIEDKSQISDVFSLKSKMFKVDSESIIISDPECIIKHLAKKLKAYQTILEYCCGVGNLTIQFAKKSTLVCGVDSHHNKLVYAEYNARISGFHEKIVFTEANSLSHINFKPDLIFLNPEWEMTNKFLMESHLISFQNMKPDILRLLEESLRLSQNIVIVLPKCININEFACIFSRLEEKSLIKGPKYSIEFEYIHLNNKLWKIYAYIGSGNSITHQEELEFISNNLNEDIDCDVLFKENTILLKQIDTRLGLHNIIRILPDILSKDYGHNKTLTFFQKFLDDLKSKNLISNNEMSELLAWNPERSKRFQTVSKNNTLVKEISKVSHNISRNTSAINLLKKLEERALLPEVQPEYCQSEYSSVFYESMNDSETEYCKDSRKKQWKSFRNEGKDTSKKKLRLSFS